MTNIPIYYPTLPKRRRSLRESGLCAMGHEATELFQGFCARCWALIFTEHRRHSLRWYWRSYGWLVCLALAALAWLALVLQLGSLLRAAGWGWP